MLIDLGIHMMEILIYTHLMIDAPLNHRRIQRSGPCLNRLVDLVHRLELIPIEKSRASGSIPSELVP